MTKPPSLEVDVCIFLKYKKIWLWFPETWTSWTLKFSPWENRGDQFCQGIRSQQKCPKSLDNTCLYFFLFCLFCLFFLWSNKKSVTSSIATLIDSACRYWCLPARFYIRERKEKHREKERDWHSCGHIKLPSQEYALCTSECGTCNLG